ncbi:hypothetical protein SDJN03_17712, partial [Cucurbita argyrosperma subsp. sororia]
MMGCLERARSSSGIFYSRIHERMLDCCYASYIAGGAWILKPEEYMEIRLAMVMKHFLGKMVHWTDLIMLLTSISRQCSRYIAAIEL